MSTRELLKRVALPSTVFLTGAGILVVEIVATRILSPYFGNTIFTFSSVISVVLAALSVGYYIGGKLADRKPTMSVFYSIVLAGGIGVFVLYWLQALLLPSLGASLPLTTGPLIVSLLLFFIPSFVLGMLSPFAIALQKALFTDKGVGSASGEMFFYSTLGSIFGSLLAGYVLIPYLGVRATLIGVATVLMALGMGPLIALGADRRFLKKLSALILISVVVTFLMSPTTKAVYSHDGVYEKIVITDGVYEGRPARFLFQDRSASGAMYLDSDELAYSYTKYYTIHQLFAPDVKRALVIGGGAYSIPKALLQDQPFATVDVSEIEPKLYELSQRYFNVPKDHPRLNNYIEDGRRMLNDAPESYDFIYGDAYHSLYSLPTHLTTKEFFQTVYDKLNDKGVFIMNVIGSLDPKPPSVIMSEVRTLKEIFPHVYLFAVSSPNTNDVQNLALVAHKSDREVVLDTDALAENPNEIIRTLPAKVVNLKSYDLQKYPVLTDNYSPIDSWTATLLRRHAD